MATLSGKNVKDWKTTVMGIVGGLVVLAGFIWPEKVSPEDGAIIKTATNEILLGIGALIPIIVALFGKD